MSSYQAMLEEGSSVDAQCPSWAPSLGYMGVAAAVCLSNWGSAVRLYIHQATVLSNEDWRSCTLKQ